MTGDVLSMPLHKIAAIVASVGLLVVLLEVTRRAAKRSTDQQSLIAKLRPEFFFWLNVIYFILLMGGAWYYVYIINDSANQAVAHTLGGILPIAVPWFGALGAVMISMQGVFLMNEQWNPKWNYWHIARPLTGSIMGLVAFFLLILINTVSGTTPGIITSAKDASDADALAGGMIAYWVLAFLVGYREETFRELIKRATDLILNPSGNAKAAPSPSPSVVFKVDGTRADQVGCGQAGVTVEVQNGGTAPLRDTDVAIAGEFAIEEDKATGHAIAPGDHRTVTVTLTGAPDSPPGLMTVMASNLDEPAKIALTAQ